MLRILRLSNGFSLVSHIHFLLITTKGHFEINVLIHHPILTGFSVLNDRRDKLVMV